MSQKYYSIPDLYDGPIELEESNCLDLESIIDGKEITEQVKEIYLKLGPKTYTILLNKELFDNKVVEGLNEILIDLKITSFRFSFTINEQMNMVLLKLKEEEFNLFQRMGLLL